MNSLHELVYDYLKQQDSSVTSKQILENAVPKYLNKKELSIVLQELEDEDRIVKGKLSNAYHYSLNPEEFDVNKTNKIRISHYAEYYLLPFLVMLSL